MQHTISNEYLELVVADYAAEPMRLTDKKTGAQYLWDGQEKWWPRRAPTPFPVVGMLKDNRFTHEGKTYELQQHGFSRTIEYTCVEKTSDTLVHELTANEETRKVYPFDFRLTITHRLQGRSVVIGWKVENTGTVVLPFSIGGHAGFQIQPGDTVHVSNANDQVPFPLEYKVLKDGLLDLTEHTLPKNDFPIDEQLFEKGVLIFDQNPDINQISILREGKPVLSLKFDGAPVSAIWAPKGAPFMCIEPWYGISDHPGVSGEIMEKPGMIKLNPGEVFEATSVIQV